MQEIEYWKNCIVFSVLFCVDTRNPFPVKRAHLTGKENLHFIMLDLPFKYYLPGQWDRH